VAEHVCPVWIGYLLASPLRKLFQNPDKILSPWVREGMTVLDVGCAMGFFTLPLARMVGPSGKVVCIDLQEKMIQALSRRARKADLLDRIDARICPSDSLGLADLNGQIDFTLLMAVVHEVPDPDRLFAELEPALKSTGRLLLAEPRGHVTEAEFDATLALAHQSGIGVVDTLQIRQSHAALLERAEELQGE
jgi:2-polyprenyl-3-methyl-5-hydroxy-6-metoxy-1,4-benzoquinol methylase